MTYHQFVNEVEMKVRGYVADNIKVQVHVAVKNNGCERCGLMISEEGINISPTIYLEEYYEKFQKGERFEQIAEDILKRYEEVRFRKPWESSFIQSFEKVKPLIVYKVINRERNEELLKEVPYREVVDLAIVCYVLLELNHYQTATMLVRKEHLELWNVTEEEVFRQAEKNVKSLLPAKISRMKDVLASMMGFQFDDEEDDFMYVMSNEERSYGAASIFYEGVMEMVYAMIGENYYIIPSSVHEVIILPESAAPKKEQIEETVTIINETQVDEEEILSNRVYYYNAARKKVAV